MPNTSGKILTSSRIAKHLILALVLFSTLITAITTAVQLFVDYRRGVSNIESGFSLVESGYLDSLTNSMWSFDDAQVKILMSGMAKLPDMEFISIRVDGQTKLFVGKQISKNVLTAEFPLQVTYRGENWTIGVLTVVASLSSIHDRLWQDFLFILVTNGIKIFLVVGFVFAVFHRMVTRCLSLLLTAINSLDLDTPASLVLPAEGREGGKNPTRLMKFGLPCVTCMTIWCNRINRSASGSSSLVS